MPLRQGRSLSLPTLPFQKTNRYAVVGVMPAFVLLCTRISHTNRYAVVGTMQVLYLLRLRISYTNRYAVDGVMSVHFYSNSAAVTPTATR